MDVLAACDLLADFTRGKSFEDYAADALRVAVQPRPDLATQITDVPAIIAFRNQLTHAYSAIDHRTVWGVLERRVPLLRSEVEPLLRSLQAE